jgi:predicted RNA-binding Zn-ribbon protein involved in translation (DUF1610 family)
MASVTDHFEVVLQVWRHGNTGTRKLRDLEDENRRLKKLLAESTIYNTTLMKMLTKGFRCPGCGEQSARCSMKRATRKATLTPSRVQTQCLPATSMGQEHCPPLPPPPE